MVQAVGQKVLSQTPFPFTHKNIKLIKMEIYGSYFNKLLDFFSGVSTRSNSIMAYASKE